jgi:hypothetical protein
MNIAYYFIGSLFTFVGIVIYSFFTPPAGIILNNELVIKYGIISLIAGLCFFLTDWVMQKASK